MLTPDRPEVLDRQTCDWCHARISLRIFHYDGKRYCCRSCFEFGAPTQIARPIFEAKPFPSEMAFFRVRARFG
jgi:hypothetical protein